MKEFDESKFKLGPVCLRGHKWENSVFTLRYKKSSSCVECTRQRRNKGQQLLWQQERFASLPTCPIDPPKFNKGVYYLGKVCLNGHEFTPEMSLRLNVSGSCYHCHLDKNKTEASLSYYRDRRAKQGEEYRKYHRDRYYADLEKNRAVRRKSVKKRRLADPDAWKAYQRLHYYRNHEQSKLNVRRQAQARKARLNQVHSTEWKNEDVKARFDLFGNECVYCGAKGSLTLDHFIPVSKKGPNCLSNIVPACPRCNYSKNNNDPIEWMAKQKFVSSSRANLLLRMLDIKKDAEVYQHPLF